MGHKKLVYRSNCLKRGLGQFPDLRGGGGGLGKKLGLCVFEVWVVDTQMHTMDMVITLTVILILLMPMSSLLISNKKVLSCN